jgi:hypothetical protein
MVAASLRTGTMTEINSSWSEVGYADRMALLQPTMIIARKRK